MKAVVILNRGGGSAGADARNRVAKALAAQSVEASILEVEGQDCADEAARAASEGARAIIAAGGDGTMSTVAGALAGSDTPMALLPLGTFNHFARDLGIPTDLDQAAGVIAAARVRQIDCAELNGRIFINNSAVGLYPLMVLDREMQQESLGRSKRLATAVAALRTLIRFHHQRLTLTVNEERKASIQTPLLFVGNNDYSIELPKAGRRDRLDQGRLSVFILRKKGRLGLIAASLRALAGRPRWDDMLALDSVTRLRVESRKSLLKVAVDGETERIAPPLDYRIRPQALRVIAP